MVIIYFTCIPLFLISCYCGGSLALYEGDNCTLKDGSLGTCKFVTDCPGVLQMIKKKMFPQICSFEGKQSIVCCAGTGGTTPGGTTARTTTTRATTITGTTGRPETTTGATVTSRTPGEVSKQKCKEYAKHGFVPVLVPTLTVNEGIGYTLDCAYQKVELIVGKTLAITKEFPHMAHLGYKNDDAVVWSCGGSLISENFVLTARHCLEMISLGPAVLVRVGLTNLSDLTHMQEREVSERFGYPVHDKSRYHDIGLLKLARKVDLDTYARPACLNTERNVPYEKGIAAGWGKTYYAGEQSNDLLKVVLKLSDVETCNKTYRREITRPGSRLKDGIIDDLMICAGVPAGLTETCQGDSGGPLQVYHPESDEIKCMYDIIGIISFGKACGLSNTPGVYTRVSAYIKWIEDIVWPE